jgi:hypothetical protein
MSTQISQAKARGPYYVWQTFPYNHFWVVINHVTISGNLGGKDNPENESNETLRTSCTWPDSSYKLNYSFL